MHPASISSRVVRVACAFLILAFLMAQAPAVSGAWARSNLQNPVQGEEPLIDNSKTNGEQTSPNSTSEIPAPPVLPHANGPEDMVDYTLPAGYSAPSVAPEIPTGPIYQGPPPGSEGLIDNTLSGDNAVPKEATGQTILPPVEEVPVIVDPTLDNTRPVPGDDSFAPSQSDPTNVELTTVPNGNLDDFNRPNGALGPSWTMELGTISIANALAESAFGNHDFNLATYNGIGTNRLEGDISIQPGGGVQYAALVLNHGSRVNNIFVKVQDSDSNGDFDVAACYIGNNGVPFGLGLFNLSSAFTSAHMQVAVDAARNVTIILTNINSGSGVQTYTCAGAPAFEGNRIGMGSLGGARIDNLSVDPASPTRFFAFNRQDGPLGSDWILRAGDISIRNQAASSVVGGSDASLATYNGLGSNSIEGDVSLSPGGGLQFAGFILNHEAGVNNIYVKVQDNDANGDFEKAACYKGNGVPSFGLGFFNLSSPFTTAHMQVSVDAARNVTITLTKINGGSGFQTYTCTGAPAAEGDGVGIASYGGGRIDNFLSIRDFQDSFSRLDGPLGSDWTVKTAGFSINNGAAQGTDSSLATYNGLGSNSIEGDVSLSAGGGYQYSGFILNYGAGVNNIFVKVQDNDGNGDFEIAACYTSNNGTPFGLGLFNLSSAFTTAHMRVTVDAARNVTMILSEINGGSGVQAYTCTGAPSAEGGDVGIASYGGGRIDNVYVKRVFAFDSFNRPDGATGPNWTVQANNFFLTNQGAEGGYPFFSSALATFNGIASNQVEGDVSLRPGGGIQYSGFVLNYGAGVNNIFVKVQDNDGNGDFESVACYKGNNGVPFGIDIFNLSSAFTTAHMRVTVDAARNVNLLFTRINGGSGIQIYTCPGAPAPEGDRVGIASYGGGRIDNFIVNNHRFYNLVFLPFIKD